MLRRLCSGLLGAQRQKACALSWRRPVFVTRFSSDEGDGSDASDQSESGKSSQQQGSQDDGRKGRRRLCDVLNEEAEEYLRNMDEHQQKLKSEIEAEIELMSWKESVPTTLSPANWKLLLTERKSIYKTRSYLRFLMKNEFSRKNAKLKKEEQRKSKIEEHLVLEKIILPSHKRKTLENRFSCYKALTFGNPLVFDMDYPGSTREEINACDQLFTCYGNNIRHEFPFHLHVTGYEGRRLEKIIDLERSDERMFATFYKGSFMDLFDHDRLLYLSPDGPLLTEHDPETVYVIGGLVDLDGRPGVSMAKAKQFGIRCGRIPMKMHLAPLRRWSNGSRYTLPMTGVFDILLNLNVMHDWGRAIIAGVPNKVAYPSSDRDASKPTRKNRHQPRQHTGYNSRIYMEEK